MEDTYAIIMQILMQNGMSCSSLEDVDLSKYIIDSFSLIAFIAELENSLNINIPSEMINFNELKSMKTFSSKLDLLKK